VLLFAALFGVCIGSSFVPSSATAQTATSAPSEPAAFYQNRTITLGIGYAAGGGYDLYGRLIAKHLPRFIPGSPNIVPQNVPAAGSLLLANQLYNSVPKDGTYLGIISNSLPLEQLLGLPQAKFDSRNFNWIGRLDDLTLILMVWHSSNVATLDDVLNKQFSIGVPGKGSTADSALSLIKLILNARYQLVTGYRSGLETKLAMERGEVDGTASVQWSTLREVNKEWIDKKQVRILVQLGLDKQPGLEDVPLAGALASDDRGRELIDLLMAPASIGRAVVAPPDVPAERVALLREAFQRMVDDLAFLNDAATQHLSLSPRSGSDLQTIVSRLSSLPAARLAEAKSLMEVTSK
jgi:tripartite-type tricarboxylate transporter receptor subunit TctC